MEAFYKTDVVYPPLGGAAENQVGHFSIDGVDQFGLQVVGLGNSRDYDRCSMTTIHYSLCLLNIHNGWEMIETN